jgi:hypothetical protein
MRAKVSRRLVIDASVARAAGGKGATFPLSKHCRDVLQTTLDVCHRVVMTDAIREEWNKHQSAFARGWRTAMIARKKIIFQDVPPHLALREEIEAAAASDRDRAALLKDIHLVEAANAADRSVMSLDDTVRALLATAAGRIRLLKTIAWVNPGPDGERTCAWLRDGAPPAKEHLLHPPRARR